MNSSRLPGKAMRDLRGRVVLGHVVDRVRQCRTIDGLWLATSLSPADDVIAKFARAECVDLFRGELDDVAARLRDAAMAANASALVRISGDSPLIDPAIVDQAVTLFRRERPSLVTNVLRRTFPKGQSVEVIELAALTQAHPQMDVREREHVTPWFYANSDKVRIVSFESREKRGDMQLSVDTAADFARAEAILMRLGEPARTHGLDAIVAAADTLARVDER
jgi:spore coat polysaccharide biosynthesis protein SpsF